MAYDTGNTYVNTFFDLMQWLKDVEEDENAQLEDWLRKSTNLDYKQKQIAYTEKQKVISFFETIIDQPAFMTNDHKRLRKLLINWYSVHRTTISHLRQSSDPFSMSSEALNEMIQCFGFPYPHKIISNNLKAQFILDIIELYKKKGTPWVLVKALQTYFGLNNVILSEWWIHWNGNTDTFYAKTHPVIPRSLRTDPRIVQELSYNIFTLNEAMWQLTETKLRELYDECAISLPSVTTYISLNGTLNVLDINIALNILNRKIQETYEFWLNTGTQYRNVYLSRHSSTCSLLELVLGIVYLFDSQQSSSDPRYQFYGGLHTPLDVVDDDGNRDDIDDIDYGHIIDEYNGINIRPSTKAQKEELLEERYSKFVGVAADQSVVPILADSANKLQEMHPNFKEELDQWIEAGGSLNELIDNLLGDLDFYMINNMGILDFPISYLIIGAPIEEKLDEVINFFKPRHTKLRDFTSILSFDDPLGDSQLEEDAMGVTTLEEIYVEMGPWSYELFDAGIVKDTDESGINDFYTNISQEFDDEFLIDDIDTVDLVTNPNGVSGEFEVIIKVDSIETDYNNLPEVIIWKTL